MSIGRPKTELVLSEDERIQVSSLARSRTLPHAIVARAKVVLWSAEGASNTEIASRLQWTKATVGKWRRRFIERRLPGLYDELRPGRPRSIEDEQVAALLKRTLSRKPRAGTHWTVREAAQVNGISKSTVHRLFQAFAIQPHRTRLSRFPPIRSSSRRCATLWAFISTRPTTRWCCVLTKRARFKRLIELNRSCRWGPGMWRASPTTTPARDDHAVCGSGYRHRQRFHRCKPRHRHQEFLAFLRHLDDASRRIWMSI